MYQFLHDSDNLLSVDKFDSYDNRCHLNFALETNGNQTAKQNKTFKCLRV